uniref:NADH dehydrogenase subunit 5 n=1 Tax=Plegadiphilus threskiornis TaxID=2965265 RepID=UPI0026E1BF78|nr:NADH dehydrogenase subunit 5 [Plegadiphilus threskiornis]WIM51534.1 NADH dehydrogenase subunit 5 [Plegadiphilus threskiornis]
MMLNSKMSNKSMSLTFLMISLISLISLVFVNRDFHLEWNLIEFNSVNLSLTLSYDICSLMFLFTVSSIFFSVHLYSCHYLEGYIKFSRFLTILMLFVLSMSLLISSGNFFFSFVGWDGLGVTSYLLILSFDSKSSNKGAMMTFLMNRFGDTMYLVCITLMSVLALNKFNFISKESSFLLGFMVFGLSITKSAQLPFSTWLPAAMEAPTPVSALVHSSTLVTAGLYILFQYKNYWFSNFQNIALIISLLTLMLSSMVACSEMDLKKIIALSTLSQLAFIVLVMSLGNFMCAFFHLIMHAFMKAMMFLAAGCIIHDSLGWQDIRKLISPLPMVKVVFIFGNMALCGLMFMSGYQSKDLIVDLVWMTSTGQKIISILLIFSFMLTVFYCSRMVVSIISANPRQGPNLVHQSSNKMMNMAMLYLLLYTCFAGSMMKWLFWELVMVIDNPKMGLSLLIISLFISIMWMFKEPISKEVFNPIFMGTKWFLDLIFSILSSLSFKFFKVLMELSDLFSLPSYILMTPMKIFSKLYNFIIHKDFRFLMNFDFFIFAFLSVMVVFIFIMML